MSSDSAKIVIPAQNREIHGLQLTLRISNVGEHRLGGLRVSMNGCPVSDVQFEDDDEFPVNVVAEIPPGCVVLQQPIVITLTDTRNLGSERDGNTKRIGLVGFGLW